MSKDYIEKMAKELCGMNNECKDCRFDKICISQNCAKIFYNLGYRKQNEGEWITDKKGFVICSECGEEHTWDEFRPPYCDMCGAKMKGGEG